MWTINHVIEESGPSRIGYCCGALGRFVSSNSTRLTRTPPFLVRTDRFYSLLSSRRIYYTTPEQKEIALASKEVEQAKNDK